MEFWDAVFVFFGGVLAHVWGQRIFDRVRLFNVYKETFVKAFILLKYTAENCESLASSIEDEPEHKEAVDAAIKFWKRLSIRTLCESVPGQVSKSLGVKDWKTALKALERITKTGSNNEL
tara:strand:+ start:98 stop:457 length:360 start_codon:yes stop_codon:yes gene_type:complete